MPMEISWRSSRRERDRAAQAQPTPSDCAPPAQLY
jgi:hypothetical protein